METILYSITIASMANPALAAGRRVPVKRPQSRTRAPDPPKEDRKPISCVVKMCESVGDGKRSKVRCIERQKLYPGGSHTFQEDGKNSITVSLDGNCNKSLSGRTNNPRIGFVVEKLYRPEDPLLAAISKYFEPPRAPHYQ